jgi:hypothetical protein
MGCARGVGIVHCLNHMCGLTCFLLFCSVVNAMAEGNNDLIKQCSCKFQRCLLWIIMMVVVVLEAGRHL